METATSNYLQAHGGSISLSSTGPRRPPNAKESARPTPSMTNSSHIRCFRCGKLGHYQADCRGNKIGKKERPIGPERRQTQPTEKESKTMLEYDVIERSNSPYGSPIVKKLDNSIRFCIDFRKLNRVTVFNREPMPSIDIFSKLHNDVYMSKLDLSKGVWQTPMREEASLMTF